MTADEIRCMPEVWTWRYPELDVMLAKVAGGNDNEIFLTHGGEYWVTRPEECFTSRQEATDRATRQANYDVAYHERGLKEAIAARDKLLASLESPFFMDELKPVA